MLFATAGMALFVMSDRGKSVFPKTSELYGKTPRFLKPLMALVAVDARMQAFPKNLPT